MWIFGQVWFACLVGFAVGVALDWAVRVRPLTKRIADLEARLANASRKVAGQDGDADGYRRSVFDRGLFSTNADGFVADRNRGGLLAPTNESTMLVDELVDEHQPERDSQTTQLVSTGVDDFPGVARLSGAWETERVEPVSPPPAEQTWHPLPVTEATWQRPEPWRPEPADRTGTTTGGGAEPDEPSSPDQDAADQQYLAFLRVGTDSALGDPGVDESADTAGDLVIGTDHTGDDHATGQYEAGRRHHDADDIGGMAGITGEIGESSSTEVTSVLPTVGDESPQLDDYTAYDTYAREEYQQSGYPESGYDSGYSSYGSYQPEEFEEPAESSTPLPRRGSVNESLRFTPFAPFEFADDPSDGDTRDAQPRVGQVTPIVEGGFQPFQKPSHALDESDHGVSQEQWLDDAQPFGHPAGEGPDLPSPSANGAHPRADDDTATGSWFDHHDTPRESASLTQRMLPVSRPDLDHPDLLPTSVFGTETDVVYDDEGPVRSLFEPVVPVTVIEDDYATPVAPTAFTPFASSYDPVPELAVREPDGYADQGTAPHPVRVRMNGPLADPAFTPVRQPEGDGGTTDAGPFGPGSALPLPDGSAPSPDFRIKARTSSMVFHTESSPFYERLEPQVWFRDAEDARHAGFTSWERPRDW
jgi:hypothetical protein